MFVSLTDLCNCAKASIVWRYAAFYAMSKLPCAHIFLRYRTHAISRAYGLSDVTSRLRRLNTLRVTGGNVAWREMRSAFHPIRHTLEELKIRDVTLQLDAMDTSVEGLWGMFRELTNLKRLSIAACFTTLSRTNGQIGRLTNIGLTRPLYLHPLTNLKCLHLAQVTFSFYDLSELLASVALEQLSLQGNNCFVTTSGLAYAIGQCKTLKHVGIREVGVGLGVNPRGYSGNTPIINVHSNLLIVELCARLPELVTLAVFGGFFFRSGLLAMMTAPKLKYFVFEPRGRGEPAWLQSLTERNGTKLLTCLWHLNSTSTRCNRLSRMATRGYYDNQLRLIQSTCVAETLAEFQGLCESVGGLEEISTLYMIRSLLRPGPFRVSAAAQRNP